MVDPLATFGSPPSAFRAILKSMKTICFYCISEHSGDLESLGGALGQPLFGVDVAQREDLEGYVRCVQKTEKGQRLLTFKGWWVNGR